MDEADRSPSHLRDAARSESSRRSCLVLEATYRDLLDRRPAVAVLPWGATEAHGWHLPHGTDVIEAEGIARRAAELAVEAGAAVAVLPTIPYGNNAQQQDQVATIHLSTTSALAILRDVTTSLVRQGIDRLVIVNGHGGNEFRPLVRDVMLETGATIVVVDFWRLAPEMVGSVFHEPGDHAGELETSLVMHLRPELVRMEAAGAGTRIPFDIPELGRAAAWSPRPWSRVHPDTGCGDPSRASPAKGVACFEAMTRELATMLAAFARAEKGQVPYL